MTAESEWARCKPWIEAALPYCYGTHTIEDVERLIAEGKMQFWPGKRSAIVSEVLEYPRLKAFNFFLVGGDLSELLEWEPSFTTIAKALGCSRISQIGRRGWGKALAPLGYETVLSVMLKEL